ncbi:MAG: glycosyltransferase family 25 protein [Pseudomonadota bacterium]
MAARLGTLIIHLARATARRPAVDALLSRAPYPAQVLDAVDGGRADTPAHAPHYPFPLSPGEVGCFQSHRAAWRTIGDAGWDGALILEDDVELSDFFSEACTIAAGHLNCLGYIQFNTRRVTGIPVVKKGAVELLRPPITPLRTSAQLVSRDASLRLLAASDGKIDRPVDTFLQMHWLTGVRVHACSPAGVQDLTTITGGSTISQPRGPWGEALRSLRRHRYRSAIARLSKAAQ